MNSSLLLVSDGSAFFSPFVSVCVAIVSINSVSDLGKISYRSYWKHVLLNLLGEHDTSKDISIKDISAHTGIKTEDIISTLQSLDMIKVWKGQHVVYVQQDVINEYMKQK